MDRFLLVFIEIVGHRSHPLAAQQRVETEKGEGEAKLARAEKEALANQRLSASLTPLLVQHEMIDKLSEKIQIMVVPQGGNFLMQLPNIAAQK